MFQVNFKVKQVDGNAAGEPKWNSHYGDLLAQKVVGGYKMGTEAGPCT